MSDRHMDPELAAMAAIADALTNLNDEDAVRRILEWAIKRFAPVVKPGALGVIPTELPGDDPDDAKDFPAFFNRANPETAIDKALVAGYWFQKVQGQEDFDSFSLNRELKHLGYPSSNITRDLDVLINRSPRLVIQTRKSGKSRQARKQYKLTHEGVRAVEEMLERSTAS